MLNILWNLLLRVVIAIVVIYGLFSLYSGHMTYVQNRYYEGNRAVTNPVAPSTLECDGVVIGKGKVYNVNIRVKGYSSGASDTWSVNGGVYKQREGEYCIKK